MFAGREELCPDAFSYKVMNIHIYIHSSVCKCIWKCACYNNTPITAITFSFITNTSLTKPQLWLIKNIPIFLPTQ